MGHGTGFKEAERFLPKVNGSYISLDFGFAQYLHDDADSRNIRGSPLYMVGLISILYTVLS